MNNTQEKIARFLIQNHLKQSADSAYFDTDGGVSCEKVCQHLGLTKTELEEAIEDMAVEVITRKVGDGLRPEQDLFDEIEALDTQRAEDANALETQQAQIAYDNQVKDYIKRAKELGLI